MDNTQRYRISVDEVLIHSPDRAHYLGQTEVQIIKKNTCHFIICYYATISETLLHGEFDKTDDRVVVKKQKAKFSQCFE